MGKFIKFERMITPIFIQIVFWLGFIAIILGGIGTVIFGFFSDTGKIMMILSGLATMFIGPIILRVYCEILIVIFKMQGSLIDIREELKNSNHSAPSRPASTPSQPAQSAQPAQPTQPTQPTQSAPTPSRQATSQQTSTQSSPPSDADDLL